ncbi:MAG: chaperone modulator CbpM [Ferruginibacter sp.]
MAAEKLIAVKEFCVHHNIDTEFVFDLHRNELIELVTIKRSRYIPERALHSVEKIIRLHNELEINIEGIQTILHLLSSLEQKENELRSLRNQLEFYI